jgi:thymidylate synthase
VKNLKIGIMQNKYVNGDGTPFSKEEFLQKLKTDKEFNEEFGSKGIDQISELIKQLKDIPDSRRMVVNAWAVHDLPNMVLPPCHYGFQVYTRELSSQERKDIYDKSNYAKDIFPTDENGWNNLFDGLNIPTRAISLMWNQRSVDTGLGLSFNIASYSLLLMMIAKQVNMIPDEVIGNLGDVHLYLNHIEPIKEQLTREPYELPIVKLSDRVVNDISEYTLDDIKLEGYQSHPTIKLPLSN